VSSHVSELDNDRCIQAPDEVTRSYNYDDYDDDASVKMHMLTKQLGCRYVRFCRGLDIPSGVMPNALHKLVYHAVVY